MWFSSGEARTDGVRAARGAALALAQLGFAACSGSQPSSGTEAADALPVAERQLAECVLQELCREVGAGLDTPGRLEVDIPQVGCAGDACAVFRG